MVETNNIWAFNASSTLKTDILGLHKVFIDKYGEEWTSLAKDYGKIKAKIDTLPYNKLTKSGPKNSYDSEFKRFINLLGNGIRINDNNIDRTLRPQDIEMTVENLKQFLLSGRIKDTRGNTYRATFGSDMTKLPERSESGFTLQEIFGGQQGLTVEDLESILKTFVDSSEILQKAGFNLIKVFRYGTVGGVGGDFMATLFVNAHASLKIASLNILPLTFMPSTAASIDKEIRAMLFSDMKRAGYSPSEKQMNNLIDDMMGKPLFDGDIMGAYYKMVAETRSVYQKLKYTVGVVPGVILAVNAATVGTTQFLAKKAGLSLSYDNELIDYLMRTEKVLRSESKTLDVDIKMNDSIGGTLSDWFIDKIADPTRWAKINTILKSGAQAIPDMALEQNVKRLAIARTLQGLGVTYKNMDKFLAMLKDGKQLKFDVLKYIHAQSSIEFKNFFGTSSVFALNRHRWSRNMIINCMQGYMFSRVGELIAAVHRFGIDIQKGKLSTWKGFKEYINDPKNHELKSFIYMPLINTKIALYTDSILNKDDETPLGKRVIKYANGLNDTLQSMGANFFGRIVSGLFEDIGAYYEYVDSTGQTVTLHGGVKVGTQSILSSIMSQLYREFKVWDTVITPLKNLKDGYSLSDALASSGTEFDSIMDGLGKFGLLPGLETFDTKALPQPDDFFGTMMMNIHETNESIRTSNKLKSMTDIEKLLNPSDTESPMLNFLMYTPVLKQFFKDDPAMSATMFGKFQYLVDTDPVLKELYKGKFNRTILNKETTDSLFKELTAMDLSSVKMDEGLKSKLSDYGLNDMKAEAFVKLLGDKMGERNLLETIAQWAPDQKKMGLAKIIAFAEHEVPGSSRILLSYISKNEYDLAVQQFNMQYKGLDKYTAKSSNQLTPNEDLKIKMDIIQANYPHMFVADKTSWFRLIETRLNQLDPKGFTISPELNKFVNSLGFLDLMAYNESRKADSSAQYIKNVYSLIGKYVNDPKQRLNLMIAANETIQNLPTEQGIRNTMRLGTVLGNIDILDKVLKDESFMTANKDIVEKALNITFGTVADINTRGLQSAREEIGTSGTGGRGSKAYRQGLYSAGKKYYPSQYDNTNRKAAEDLQDRVPSLIKNLPATYTPKKANSAGYNIEAKYNIPKPVQYQDYLQWEKVFNPNKAESAQLVSGYVRRNPQDVFDKATARTTYKTPQFKTIASIKIPKGKRIWKNPAYEANS